MPHNLGKFTVRRPMYRKYTGKLRITMRNGINVQHTDTQINVAYVHITQAVISYSKLACDCNYHMRCTHVREKKN